MNNKSYLNEETYEKGKKKISTLALIVLVVGLFVGGSLIVIGLTKKAKVNSIYSEENKQNEIERLEGEITTEENKLKEMKSDLESKGVKFNSFTEYDDGESYDLKVITEVMNPSYNRCLFDEYENNSITKKYCSLKNELDDVKRMDVDFEKDFNSFDSIPFFMFGAFIIIATCMSAGSIYMVSKRREITAFTVQQVMPIAQEGMEKMAPTIGKVDKTIASEMAPAYGEIAKEISKGIKEGVKDDEK